jgi:hypothetical protein
MPRPIRLYFYYPQASYLSELNTAMVSYHGPIDCRDLFPSADPKERIVIYELGFDEKEMFS